MREALATLWRFCHNAAFADVEELCGGNVRFSELVGLLEASGFTSVKEKGSIRYYAKVGWPNLIRVDYHGSKEVPTGTCHSILKAAGLKK